MSSTQLVSVNTQSKATALDLMADRLSVDPTKLFATLKATCFKGASNEEMLALVAVSNRYGLDPLTKQIYAFPSKGGITPVVSVDGWLHILNSQPQFDGIEFAFEDGPDGRPVSVTASVYRKDRSRPTKVTEYFSECARATEPWKQFPRRMLRHKAVKEAVRVAFGISGITDEDEARDIAKNATASVAAVVTAPVVEALPEPEVEAVAEAPKKKVRYKHIPNPPEQEGEVVAAELPLPAPAQEPEWAKELEKRCFEYEPRVNSFLVAKGLVGEGQTFRDLKDEAYIQRVLKNTPGFIDAVVKFTEVKEAA